MTTVAATADLYSCLRYEDAPAAIEWLERAFGFQPGLVVPGDDGSVVHAQMSFGTGGIMLGSIRDDQVGVSTPRALGGSTQSVYAIVDDADAHYARAREAGAEIVRELADQDYGSREYSARDPEGHLWTFGTYRPSVTT
ncbi:MAG: bleomycin resistance protein [Solirubrobacterales bacterium]|nr:bleomycin resistance protein [Solirubrobacterales bacterium]